jgi:hypothetical protein
MRRPTPGGFEGGCRARAQTFAGSVDAADPWLTESRRSAGAQPHPAANVELVGRTLSLPLVSSH